MAKSKNHTSHTANFKDHRNGIKKAKVNRYSSLKGMDQAYKKNLKYVRMGNAKVVREVKAKLATEKTAPVKVVPQKKFRSGANPYRFVRPTETPEERKVRVEKQKSLRAALKTKNAEAKKARSTRPAKK